VERAEKHADRALAALASFRPTVVQ